MNHILEKAKKQLDDTKLAKLKALTEHEGWKVLLHLCELHKLEIGLSVSKVDFDDADQVKKLKNRQIYLDAFQDILDIPRKEIKEEILDFMDESELVDPQY